MARPHGTKYIESPEKLWDLFVSYKKELEDNPFQVVEQKKGTTSIKITASKSGAIDFKQPSDLVFIPTQKPLTMVGFECYVMEHTKITYPDLTAYFEGKDESYKDYFPISTRIKKEIENNQLSGGLCNIFNPSLTARINGYADKRETELKGSLNIPNVPNIGKRK